MTFKYILGLLFTGEKANEPVRLNKKQNKTDLMEFANGFVERNFYIIALLIMVLALITFVALCFAIMGIGATESGMTYNGMHKVI